MSKLPPLKRVHTEDIQDAPSWMQRILLTVNSFFQNVWQALDNGLTFRDNFDSQIVTLQYTGGRATLIPTTLKRPIEAIIVAQLKGAGITGGQVIWRQLGELIEISDVTGTVSGQPYEIKLILL